MKKKIDHIIKEIKDLDIRIDSERGVYLYNEAIHAVDILSKRELTDLIEDHNEFLPLDWGYND